MNAKTETAVPALSSIGIDIGKDVFHLVGFDTKGKIILRKKIKRLALADTFKKNLRPVFANKYPYFTRPKMAGLYLPNPYHPPTNNVRIATRFGMKWAEVMTEPVPKKWVGFPQYQNGYQSYVKGYRFL